MQKPTHITSKNAKSDDSVKTLEIVSEDFARRGVFKMNMERSSKGKQ